MWRICIIASIVISLRSDLAAADAGKHLKKPYTWFAGDEARQIAANIISYQSDLGGWPKNQSTTTSHYEGDPKALGPTYDNGATTDELRFLARMYNATRDARYLNAFERGLDYVLNGQYPNGGWPQSHPPGKGYPRHITFNDNVMIRLLEFVREVANEDRYSFVDNFRRTRAATAFDRGIACILKCQIKADNKLTAWCAQHDEIDFRPRPARSYELATLSGAESVGVTRLLMSLDNPSTEVVRAIEAAIAWFEIAKLTGIRVTLVKDETAPKGTNRVVVNDPTAPPLWARFYAIETNKPIFVDRDGVPKQALADIGYERRNGYAWYGTWPKQLLEDYPAWRARVRKMLDR